MIELIEDGDLIYTEVLEAISIYLITPLFIKTLLDIIKNKFGFFSILFLFDKNL